MQKSLDVKLAAIHADPHGCDEFIIADAKDADMAFGVPAPGSKVRESSDNPAFKSLADYREQVRQVIRQGVVDIVLMSVSTAEKLFFDEHLFDDSHVTPAIRANDATDIFVFRGSDIATEAAKPFRTARLDHAQCGHLDCDSDERPSGIDLGLYSVTFNNDCKLDLGTLEAYNAFRDEAERKGFRHFLEVFHPNLPNVIKSAGIGTFINDVVARTLAGVPTVARPIFLKIPYPGPAELEELVSYDPHLIVGILGGSSGTTRDAFQLIYNAKKHGAKVALFGRKINHAENQLAFIEFLRHIVDGVIAPDEAVKAYHSVLAKLKISPHRELSEDIELTVTSVGYAGQRSVSSTNSDKHGSVDFARMTSEERLAYHLARLRRL